MVQVVLFIPTGWPCGRRLLDKQEVLAYALFISTEWPCSRRLLDSLAGQDSYRFLVRSGAVRQA